MHLPPNFTIPFDSDQQPCVEELFIARRTFDDLGGRQRGAQNTKTIMNNKCLGLFFIFPSVSFAIVWFSSKAFSFSHSWITFRGSCNQWSDLKAPRFFAAWTLQRSSGNPSGTAAGARSGLFNSRRLSAPGSHPVGHRELQSSENPPGTAASAHSGFCSSW